MMLRRCGARRQWWGAAASSTFLQQQQVRWLSRHNSSRGKVPLSFVGATGKGSKSEWWAVDGELHEIGDDIPPRERFLIPRDNIPNRRRKVLREQFMRRTRLIIRDSDHDSWCKHYMQLYQELREDWERLYWDEGYSKKIAQDHAIYESAEDDDADFSLNRRWGSHPDHGRGTGFGRGNQDGGWQRDQHFRDKFECDRERRMRAKAFAPMNMGSSFNSSSQPFGTERFSPGSPREPGFRSYGRNNAPVEPSDANRFFPKLPQESGFSSYGRNNAPVEPFDANRFSPKLPQKSGFRSHGRNNAPVEPFDPNIFFPKPPQS